MPGKDLVHFDQQGMGSVVAQQLKALMLDVMPCSGEKVGYAEHLVVKLQ